MADPFKIVISTTIDTGKSKTEINSQLTKLQKEIQSLKLQFGIDQTSLTKSAKESAAIFKTAFKEIEAAENQALKANQLFTATYISGAEKSAQASAKVFQAEQKRITQTEKQMALYKDQMAISLQNAKSQYGSSYSSKANQAAVSNINNILSGMTVENFAEQSKRANLELSKMHSNLKAVKVSSEGMVNTLIKDAGKMLAWTAVGTAIFGTMNAIKSGISYIIEMDNALNEIRIVTGQTQSQVDGLALSYNKLAKEMSVTTTEITKTAADLYRQGLTASEVTERMKGIIQYAKISSISLDESNKIITATANATGEPVNKIIDLFSMLGDATASGKIVPRYLVINR